MPRGLLLGIRMVDVLPQDEHIMLVTEITRSVKILMEDNLTQQTESMRCD